MAKVKITIDGNEIEVEEGLNLIEAAAQIKTKVPHYCYHPGLNPDGNCRMCLVQVEKIPKPVIACKTGAAEGMVVHTKTPEVEKMRSSIMEFLLVNHPLDCPTCDQAGECRLQDYYMDYDRIPSRYQEEKVKKDKMVDLGAGVMLDEERCIVCTRCVRVCQEVAQNEELYVQERGNHSMVATFPGKPMSNPYAGNTVDACPVGALTSKDFRYKKRVWFLSETESVCPGCSRGCNISLHHADRKVFRLKPRHNDEINKYWMCDFGRHDYKFINENRRLRAGYQQDGSFKESLYQKALEQLAHKISAYQASELAFIAHAQESNEAISEFVEFAKNDFQADHVYFSKHDPKDPYSDDILITADKNPNMAHIQTLGLKSVDQITSDVKAILIQRNLSDADLKVVQDKGLTVIALFSTNPTKVDDIAQTIFPIPTYAEQEGHFTNIQGTIQKFKAAFEAWGESKPIQTYLSDLRDMLQNIKIAS